MRMNSLMINSLIINNMRTYNNGSRSLSASNRWIAVCPPLSDWRRERRGWWRGSISSGGCLTCSRVLPASTDPTTGITGTTCTAGTGRRREAGMRGCTMVGTQRLAHVRLQQSRAARHGHLHTTWPYSRLDEIFPQIHTPSLQFAGDKFMAETTGGVALWQSNIARAVDRVIELISDWPGDDR